MLKEILSLPSSRLKRVVEIKTQIDRLHNQLATLIGEIAPPGIKQVHKARRRMSAAARAKIAAAAKARWAKVRAAKK